MNSDPNKPQGAPAASEPSRDSKGRFAKGHTGNPSGRPVKRERSFLPRQRRRDIFAVTEEMFPIKTERGTVMMSAYEIVLRKIRKKAFDGHNPSMRMFIKLHLEALLGHYEDHKIAARDLDMTEAALVIFGKPVSNDTERSMNIGRKNSRRT